MGRNFPRFKVLIAKEYTVVGSSILYFMYLILNTFILYLMSLYLFFYSLSFLLIKYGYGEDDY